MKANRPDVQMCRSDLPVEPDMLGQLERGEMRSRYCALVLICFASLLIPSISSCSRESVDLGLFEASTLIGQVGSQGSVEYEADKGRYLISGSGANIWGESDSFHFVSKQLSGDLVLSADIQILGDEGDPQRKAGWMVRASLAPDAPYADAVIHGDGLVSLQYRRVKGGPSDEIRYFRKAPARIRLERHGDVFSLFVSDGMRPFQPAGSVVVEMPNPVHVGLAICAHDKGRLQEVLFNNVSIHRRELLPGQQRVLESSLEVLNVESGERRLVRRAEEHFEAPNWSPDGKYFIYNSAGLIYQLGVEGGLPRKIDTGSAVNCNNDHGLSPDGQTLAISSSKDGTSLIYLLPVTGGEPRLITWRGPSYWHGWSPDGSRLVYCARRNGEFDIYSVSVLGGGERRLTWTQGLDDGPDFSPDGKFIYINSERTGLMKIWRISPDGRTQEQMTFDDEFADWFPHPSPDGKWIIFLSYDKEVDGHPPNKEVALRIMPAEGGEPRIVARLFGGQGTINVPSWSPNSKYVAFVSYREVIP